MDGKIVYHLKTNYFDDLKNTVKKTTIVAGICVALSYPILPILCYFSPKTIQQFVFGCYASKSNDITNLKKNGIKSKGRNFYLQNKKGLRIGLYHIFPISSMFPNAKNNNNEKYFEEALKSFNDPIILYCHGIIGDRGKNNRVNIYNQMSSWNYHVIALDYFGFGDSDGEASEESCVESIVIAVEYLYSFVGSNFFVWGHSFGTSVLLNALNVLDTKGIVPLGCFLESPFNNCYDSMKNDWKYKIYSWIPYIDNIMLKPIKKSGLICNSSLYIQTINCPIQIFHADDDLIVPVELCQDLYQHAIDANRDVEIKIFSEKLGHENIYKAKDLGEIVAKFESKCLNKRINQNKL
uniref:2-arachidonoylglycerol hydrolase ABHD12 n=1 Tax=Strongyloides stercoralis TaxID=6248 RepID=A0A0K0DXB7_STRER